MAINKKIFRNLVGGGLLSLAALIPNANAQDNIFGEIKDVPYLKTDIYYHLKGDTSNESDVSIGYKIGTTINGISFNLSGDVNLSPGGSSFLKCNELKIDRDISKNTKIHYRAIFDGDVAQMIFFRINF